jgi:hypothetical protein
MTNLNTIGNSSSYKMLDLYGKINENIFGSSLPPVVCRRAYMGAIVIRTRFDEGMESAKVVTSGPTTSH